MNASSRSREIGDALRTWKDQALQQALSRYNARYENDTYTAFRDWMGLLDGEAEAVRRANLLTDAALCVCGSPCHGDSLPALFDDLPAYAAALAIQHLAHFI